MACAYWVAMENADPRILPVDAVSPAASIMVEAARVLQSGALVILPTETVYGVAADPRVEGAEDRIYAAKERDRGKPIPLLAGSLAVVERLGAILSPRARRLAKRYWPGPLTLVLACGGKAEGFRVPDHPVAGAVLKAAGGVLRVTSANISGEPAARTVAAAVAALGSRVALALDAGPAPLGRESTVVDATGESLKILRQGVISQEAIMNRRCVLFVCTGNTCRSPMAEYLLRRWLGSDSEWDADSAGVSAVDGQPASEGAVQAMAGKKADLSSHASRFLTRAHIDDADLIVVMTGAHKRAVEQRFPGTADRIVLLNAFSSVHPGEDVPDPFGMKADVYRAIRDEIDAAMPELVMYLRGLVRNG